MSVEFEANTEDMATLVSDMTAVTVYVQELMAQVGSRTRTEGAAWAGAASDSLMGQMAVWQTERNAMVTELQTLVGWVSNAREQYELATEAIRQAWA